MGISTFLHSNADKIFSVPSQGLLFIYFSKIDFNQSILTKGIARK